MSEDILKLSRSERRRRERELAKQNKKSGIKPNVPDDERIEVTKAELKRLVDVEVTQRLILAQQNNLSTNKNNYIYNYVKTECDNIVKDAVKSEREYIFKQVVYEQLYILCFILCEEYNFGGKRLLKTINRIIDVWYEIYDKDKEKSQDRWDFIKFVVDVKTDNALRSKLDEKLKEVNT